jgi:ribosome-binding protein aMBF1 (putative translation factor)
VSYLAEAALHLDHRENRPGDSLAKKILYGLFVVPASPNHANDPCERSVAKLLQQIGELPVPEARDRNWGMRTREALEAALTTLEEAGLVALVEWPDGFGPDDVNRVKGWVERWLAARVRITGLEAHKKMQEAREKMLAAPPTKSKSSKPAAPPPRPEPVRCLEPSRHRTGSDVDAQAIRRKLGNLHWQQSTLAKHIDCSENHLSYVMNGRRKAGKDMVQALRDFLATSDEKLQGD